MTTEEKAKAYDKALETCKRVFNFNNLSYTHCEIDEKLKQIFPELAESEDERIRKWIIGIINGCKELSFEDKAKLTKWLEKQKEQKPVHTAKEMWKEMRIEVYAQASGNRHEPNYSDDSTKMFSLCDIDEIFEKIGDSTVSSQPVEWSAEDKRLKQVAIRACEQVIQDYPNDIIRFRDCIAWLKSLPSRFALSHWKPSEEQMKRFNAVIVTDRGIWGIETKRAMESLYKDLNKLREE